MTIIGELYLYPTKVIFTLKHSVTLRRYIQDIHKRMARFQKAARNVFLTLYRHNVRRQQQQQLSKFLMRYQQFASHAYCGAAGPVSKMASRQEKALCVYRVTRGAHIEGL
jgi:hypothetical protein